MKTMEEKGMSERIKVKREGRSPKREEGPKEQRNDLGSCNLWDVQSRLVDRRAVAGVVWRGVVVVVLCDGWKEGRREGHS